MEKTNKFTYEAPAATVVEVKAEGVICTSGTSQTSMEGRQYGDIWGGNDW